AALPCRLRLPQRSPLHAENNGRSNETTAGSLPVRIQIEVESSKDMYDNIKNNCPQNELCFEKNDSIKLYFAFSK
uniref:hypothetical protein n=1 Tax=Atopococcus tabaci TaxID=269774 RepID=UPI002408FEEF